MSSGLVIGKFLPPHRGHKYLIDFARAYVSDLTVQVCSIASEPIPGELRYTWMCQGFGDVRVVWNNDPNPQEPEECPDRFWQIWRESLLKRMEGGRSPDYVFASEPYGLRLAQELDARFVPVDIGRELVPISGTAIRCAPLRHWDAILAEARPYFAKRVAILGPESSGKSTLAKTLAAHYQTCYCTEYARSYLDAVGMQLDAETFANILQGHQASEEAMLRQCRRVLFSDTESIVTRLWAEILLGYVPDFIELAVQTCRYDLYLVTSATSKWIEDSQRFQPEWEARHAFCQNCQGILDGLNRKYVLLEGSWTERQQQAMAAVDALLTEDESAQMPGGS